MEEPKHPKELEEFNILACDTVFSKVEPHGVFGLNYVLKDFDYKKYEHIKYVRTIKSGEQNHNDPRFRIVREWMTGKGYIEKSKVSEMNDAEGYYTCELTDDGRTAQRKGGHKKYTEFLELDGILKNQMIEVNKSSLDTNALSRSNIKIQRVISISTFCVALVSALFIGINTWRAFHDTTKETQNRKIEAIQQGLQQNSAKSDSILSYLSKEAILIEGQNKNAPTNKQKSGKQND